MDSQRRKEIHEYALRCAIDKAANPKEELHVCEAGAFIECEAELTRMEQALERYGYYRCAVCGWPLAESVEKGCVRGNCSLRPVPLDYFDGPRAEEERKKALPRA